MNKVIKKSCTVKLLSFFVFASIVLSGYAVPLISVAYAQSASCGLAGASVANSISPLIPSAGGTITYTLDGTTANISASTSTATSTAITIDDSLDLQRLTFVSSTANIAGASYSNSTGVWNLGTLNNGTYIHLQLTATINAGTEGQVINNAPTINYTPSDNSCAQSNAINGISVTVDGTPSAPLTITKTANPTSVVAGSTTTVEYTITVTNNSTSTMSNGVMVNDRLPSGLIFESSTAPTAYNATSGVWTVGNLSVGSTASLSIYAEVAQSASATITNTATVTASTTDSNSSSTAQAMISVTQPTSTPTTTTPFADLLIVKTVSPTSTTMENVSSTVDYTITVTNNSTTTTSTEVVATDVLPAELTFESATVSTGTPMYASSTNAETWTIGNLLPSAAATLDIEAMVNSDASSTLWNAATVTASTTDPNAANNRSSVWINVQQPTSTPSSTTPSADLSIVKTVSPTSVAPGSTTTVEYDITVANASSSATTSENVAVSDSWPSGLTFVSSSAPTAYNATSGVWTVGSLAPGASSTLMITAEVDSDVTSAITNTATVTASTTNPNSANDSAQATITMQSSGCTSNCGGGGGGGSVQANIGITKTVDNSNPATGATIHYTLTVSDAGPSDAFGVVASDTLPTGVTFDSASSSEGSYNSSTGIWKIGTIADSHSATLMITATVNAAAGTTITNIGTVSESSGILNVTLGKDISSATITVAGGGQVLGASTSTVATSTGQVLGARCGLYLTSYIHPYRQKLNDSTQVKKLQTFLNTNLGLDLPVTGYYGKLTIAAVNQFQVKYHNEVLTPWVPLGLPTPYTPTNYVYQSTQRWINLIMCPSLNLPLPALKVDNGE
jgi:uncharacterized repeat protein (TIGR01451 family)